MSSFGCCGQLPYKNCKFVVTWQLDTFGAIKSELIHFTRARRPNDAHLKILGDNHPGLAPKESVRFLGV